MSVPSAKKNTILAIGGATKGDLMKGGKLVLLTPTGVLTGVLHLESNVDDDAFVDPKRDLLPIHVRVAEDAYIEDSGKDAMLDGNDGCIILNDAVLINLAGLELRFNQIVVFFDQIVGATFTAES